MKIVIRAGGVGTRLWPMSRKVLPKQFQKIAGDRTMIQTTFDRIRPLLNKPEDLFVSVNHLMVDKLLAELPELARENMIIETESRNTGPAMCLEVCFLEKFCQPEDIIASLTSDDFVSDSEAFRDLLLGAESFIEKNHEYILTPAVKPQFIDTGYSYFKAGENLQQSGEEAIFTVDSIAEKPNLEYCKELIESGVYFCHTGMYIWQLGNIIKLWEEYQPAMVSVCRQIVKLMSSGLETEKIAELYCQLEKVTVETAITNKIDKIAMSVSNRVGWSDLGKWHVIKNILCPDKQENLTRGMVMANQSANNLIYSTGQEKIIVVNDINNLVVVDTGDVLFISSLEKSADVKNLTEKLKEQGLEKYL